MNKRQSSASDEPSVKKQLGQFYTTNYEYILQNFEIPSHVKNVIEPFAGNGDLLPFVNKSSNDLSIECYDLDPKKSFIKKRDTLLNPPDYNGKFVITNPPYLARNKSKDKTVFLKYDQNDLYKCFIDELTRSQCVGGILIIPLNFWCSIRRSDIELRKRFISVYNVPKMNIFEERVFDDTSYTICSFQFEIKSDDKQTTAMIYPSCKSMIFSLTPANNFTIGGEIYNLRQDKKIHIERLTKKNASSEFRTNILAKCIDDSSENKIKLSFVSDNEIYIDKTAKSSARSYATLVIEPKITKKQQKKLVQEFNTFLEEKRKKYNSLFLTNYRESTSIARKRISFKLIFQIVNYLLAN